jgi:BASS family bile acid:Na+ symporter
MDLVSFQQFMATVGSLAGLTFVICSMLAMGFTLAWRQILQPLRDLRMVVMALLVGFVLVPLVALALAWALPLPEEMAAGLVLVGFCAGCPFLPKLAMVAKGDRALSVGLMVLLMVATIALAPLALPVLVEGVDVSAWELAQSLIVLLLLPLTAALLVNARYPKVAESLAPAMAQAANLSLALLLVAVFVAYFDYLVEVIGTTAIIASLVFVPAAFAIGWLLGGKDPEKRKVLALAAGYRNISAALAIGATAFEGPDVLVMVLVVSLVGLIVMMVAAGEMGRRSGARAGGEKPPGPVPPPI